MLWQRPRRAEAASLAADIVAEQLVANGLRLVAEVKLAWLDTQAALAYQLADLADGRLRAGLERSRIMTLSALLDANGEGRDGFELGPGLAVELPVLSQNQGGKARAAAELDQAGRRYLAVRAAVVAGVDDAFIRLTDAESAGHVLDGAIGGSLDIEREQAQRLYDAGEISLLDLLETRQRLIDADAARLDAEAARRRALVRLEEAIGRSCEVG